MQLIILSGRSGSGKTIALHCLEDLGFYCVDNLPLSLLPKLMQLLLPVHSKLAVGIDARNLFLEPALFEPLIVSIRQSKHPTKIIYLDAQEDELVKRFSETRRKHPMSNDQVSLREALQLEHQFLAPIGNLADIILDTSQLSLHALAKLIKKNVEEKSQKTLQILLQSFGFKYGLPPDADFIFDIRCLPNPYWHAELRELNGHDKKVQNFLSSEPLVQKMQEALMQFLNTWIKSFESDNRSYLTICIGCTGGKHRSVYMVEHLAKCFINFKGIQIRHRELPLPKSIIL